VHIVRACGWFGIRRQSYYQTLKRRQERAAQDQPIVEWVDGLRALHPRMGGLKLHHKLSPKMRQMGLYRGRDAFFELLKHTKRLVPRKKKRPRTTCAGIWRCPNRLAGLAIQRPHQAWVGDITYLTTQQGFVYLALLTDAYSHFIVGFDVSGSLAHTGCLRALQAAIEQAPQKLEALVHHSDHGFQYTAAPYYQVLLDKGIQPSMGAVGNCYENPLAERMNGILKDEYSLDHLFVDLGQAQRAAQQAVRLYNFERPHRSLKLCTPAEIHYKSDVICAHESVNLFQD